MTCKDCIHYDACKDMHDYFQGECDDLDKEISAEHCSYYKNKANFVELPCKVGDTVYKLCSVNSSIKMGQMWDGRIVETNCDRCGYRNCSCYDIGLREWDNPHFINVIEDITIHNLEFLVKIMPYFSTIYFTTKEQAEQMLKGGADNG
jgi:hypothetical protein